MLAHFSYSERKRSTRKKRGSIMDASPRSAGNDSGSCVHTSGSDRSDDSNEDDNDDEDEYEELHDDMERYKQYFAVVNDDDDDEHNNGMDNDMAADPAPTASAETNAQDAQHKASSGSIRGSKNSRIRTTPSLAPPSYYVPPTASTPVTSHFDAILECLDLLRTMERDASVEKQDVVESLRSMLNNMLSTVMMHSFATSMSVRGWRVE